jgi:hypothetical protein
MEGIVNRYTALAIISAGLSVGVAVVSAATPAIGVAMSEGTILVNDTQTPGNATIFSGTTLQTQRTSSQVRLKDGGQVRFDSDSRGKVFSDHVDLLQGSARISGYSANVSGLNVRAEGDSSASVTLKGKVVEVAALTGDVRVFNAAGVNVANILPGRALDLRLQEPGASSASSLVGCPVKSGSNFLLTDQTSNVTVQLRGGKITAGQHVQVTGSMIPDANGGTQVIAVTSVKDIPGPCAGAGNGTALAATAGAPAGAGAPVGIVAVPIIIGGAFVITGGTLGGLAGAGVIGGSSTPCVSTSAQPCPL